MQEQVRTGCGGHPGWLISVVQRFTQGNPGLAQNSRQVAEARENPGATLVTAGENQGGLARPGTSALRIDLRFFPADPTVRPRQDQPGRCSNGNRGQSDYDPPFAGGEQRRTRTCDSKQRERS